MSIQHISFEKISDLLDNDISLQEEREHILQHISECSLCKKEYEYLKATITFCSELSQVPFPLDDLCQRTLKKVQFKKQKKLAYKIIPAVAASILLIVGFAMDDGLFSDNDSSVISQGSNSGATGDENILQIIQENDASITKVTDIYVEGKISIARFNQLRRHLGSRVVTYSVIDEVPAQRGNPIWRAGMEQVGTGNGMNYPPDYIGDTRNAQRFVLFRIHR